MAAGSKTQIVDRPIGKSSEARVTNFRLWVDATISGGSGCLNLCVEETLAVGPSHTQVLPLGLFTRNSARTVAGSFDNIFTRIICDSQSFLWTRDKATIFQGDTVPVGSSFEPYMIPPGVERDDALTTIAEADGEWTHLRCASRGTLWVQGLETVGYSTAVSAFGVGVAAERDDVLAALPELNGEWTRLRTNNRGALWVTEDKLRNHFSGSTDGQPIQITTVATAGDLIHTATADANLVDRLFISVTNTGVIEETITFEWGGAGAAFNLVVPVPCGDTILAVAGAVMANSNVVRAFASNANVLNVAGYFVREPAA